MKQEQNLTKGLIKAVRERGSSSHPSGILRKMFREPANQKHDLYGCTFMRVGISAEPQPC